MPSVFHYTHSAGLLGILQSKTLFATDYRYLNDVSEGSMIKEPIVKMFAAEIETLVPALANQGLLTSLVGHRHLEEFAEQFYQSIVHASDTATPIYVLSFCRHKSKKLIEHGLLSQWRGYAGSAGFAIEFDERKLCKLVEVENSTFGYVMMKSDRVQYKNYNRHVDPDVYRGVAGELIRRRLAPIRDVSDITGRMGREEMDGMMVNFGMTRPFLKHDGFEEEKEYRIVAARVRHDKIRPEITHPPAGRPPPPSHGDNSGDYDAVTLGESQKRHYAVTTTKLR